MFQFFPNVIEDRAVSQPRNSYAVGTGLFIVLGFAALAYLATQTTSVANVHQGASYTVDAHFANIGQLKERAPVKIAGVRIGQVQSITLEPGARSGRCEAGDRQELRQDSAGFGGDDLHQRPAGRPVRRHPVRHLEENRWPRAARWR
jgi:hypothetical protein